MREEPESLNVLDAGSVSRSRRRFLKWCAVAGAGTVLPPGVANAAMAVPEFRALDLYNTNTGERIRLTYAINGQHIAEALTAFNRLLRDHRTGDVHDIDPGLLDLLHDLQTSIDRPGTFHIMSGYRSPTTNALLRRKNEDVAENSLHLRGKAIDVYLPGCEIKQLRKAAADLRCGGVGYYPRENFVHLDTGPVRYW